MHWLFEPVVSGFPNRLSTPHRFSEAPPRAMGVLFLLLVVCFVPRAFMAWKLDLVCPDGVTYLELASAIDEGDIPRGLGALGLTTYPATLAVLHRAGLGWEATGKLWGITVASLVVLPLFGWLRRQFDQRVATVGCLLYACHPKLIEWSPELVRGPTFWFLWVFSIYATWRAVTEIRLEWFVTAGVAIALALHTRFEGWFLFVPLLCWSAWRIRALAGNRCRLAAGVGVAVAMCPILLWTVNVTWLRHQPNWEWGNFQRLQYVALWAQATFPDVLAQPDREPNDSKQPIEPPPRANQLSRPMASVTHSVIPAVSAKEPETVSPSRPLEPTPLQRVLEPPPRMAVSQTILNLAHNSRRGCGTVFGLLMFGGAWAWRRVWCRRDYQPLVWTILCVTAGIWFHLWYAQATSSRYWLSIVLLATPFIALALMGCARWLARVVVQRVGIRLRYGTTLAGLIVLLTVWGWADALSSKDFGRRGEAALGRWLVERFDAKSRLLLPTNMAVCRYYSRAAAEIIPFDGQTLAPVALLDQSRPDVAVISRGKSREDVCQAFVEEAVRLGFSRVSHTSLPDECDASDLIVVVRDESLPRVVGRRPRK